MKKPISPNSGVTLLELTVAIFIFSITSYSLFQGLHTGDKIHGKAKISRAAATIASSEAERIRNAALQGARLQDSEYTETVSGVTYAVQRKTVNASDINIADNEFTEYEIRVEPQGTRYEPRIFKLVQGYRQ
jgi:prepilin-type N-terminal cleavage/methylation domain-containing protein